MSNPDTPPQNPTTPVASDPAAATPEPSASVVDTASNGKLEQVAAPRHGAGAEVDAGAAVDAIGDDAADAHDDPSDQADTSTTQPLGENAAGAGGEKKRRRRRRRKKPNAQTAGAEGSSESSEQASEGALGETGADAGADAQQSAQDSTASAFAGRGQHTRDRKKERKHPPRERPPVNAGDIIFGKILDITDEAIFVDIPGKAHAIFDRKEMLLPDDDDPRRPMPAPQPVEIVGDVRTGAVGEDGISPSEGEAASTPAETMAHEEASSDREHSAAIAPDVPQPSLASAPEPPREPKVPRVILEEGADFIAVVHNDGARGGLVVLTHHPNRAEKTKAVVERAFQEKTTALGLVTGVIKGGIEVDVDGLRAFAPGSHVDLRMGADLSHLVGKRLPFYVTQYAKRGRDVVLSRKSIIEEDAKKARTEALARLKVGEELDGVVRSVVPFGAFVDVGGVEGLVPLQEMSHNRGDGPSDVFKAGEPTRVRVIKVDDRGKVWLSRKATIPDPWQEVAQKYAQGTRHAGKVVRLQPFGAFIELEPGVDGLIHTQDLSIKRIEIPDDVVKVNDTIDVVVANVDAGQHKIALHPAPLGDSANEPTQKVAQHKAVKVRIVAIESGGLVVRILGVTGRNARGYVTAAGTGTPRGTELRKAFKVGQDIEAKVVEVDPRRGEVKLSIKALSEEQERSAYQQYRQQLKAEARFTLADMLTKKGSSR